jgi:hypothetical protein
MLYSEKCTYGHFTQRGVRMIIFCRHGLFRHHVLLHVLFVAQPFDGNHGMWPGIWRYNAPLDRSIASTDLFLRYWLLNRTSVARSISVESESTRYRCKEVISTLHFATHHCI